MKIKVKSNEVTVVECEEPADMFDWLDRNMGVTNYEISWQGVNCFAITLTPKYLNWFMLVWS